MPISRAIIVMPFIFFPYFLHHFFIFFSYPIDSDRLFSLCGSQFPPYLLAASPPRTYVWVTVIGEKVKASPKEREARKKINRNL
jgi:hypothetical protein